MDLNLDTLKHEILEYLDSTGFAVFHSSPGALDGFPLVLWDTEGYPDYQMFLEVARKSDVKVILFAAREFDSSDLDDLMVELDDCELSREEHREYESRLRELRIFAGVTCSLEVAFDYNSRLYVYEVQPTWYEEFLSVEDEIATRAVDDEDTRDDEPLGGYFFEELSTMRDLRCAIGDRPRGLPQPTLPASGAIAAASGFACLAGLRTILPSPPRDSESANRG